jgi:hypothetical protein
MQRWLYHPYTIAVATTLVMIKVALAGNTDAVLGWLAATCVALYSAARDVPSGSRR